MTEPTVERSFMKLDGEGALEIGKGLKPFGEGSPDGGVSVGWRYASWRHEENPGDEYGGDGGRVGEMCDAGVVRR
jgi:hypothetical protein